MADIHTDIIGHYNPTVRFIELVSHTTYVVCDNFTHKWRDLQFKVDSERRIFWETFHGNFYFHSELLPDICWEEIAEEIHFVFCFDVWLGVRTLAFCLISQHTTYQTTAIYVSLWRKDFGRTSYKVKELETHDHPLRCCFARWANKKLVSTSHFSIDGGHLNKKNCHICSLE